MFKDNRLAVRKVTSPYIPDGIFPLEKLVAAEAYRAGKRPPWNEPSPIGIEYVRSPLQLIDDLANLLPRSMAAVRRTRVVEWANPKTYEARVRAIGNSIQITVNSQPPRLTRREKKIFLAEWFSSRGLTVIRANSVVPVYYQGSQNYWVPPEPEWVEYRFATITSPDQYPQVIVRVGTHGICEIEVRDSIRNYFDVIAGIGVCVDTLLRQVDDQLVLEQEIRGLQEG